MEQNQKPANTAPQNNANATDDDLIDFQIEHDAPGRKAHPGHGEHFVGNAAETLQAPITNEPVDQTRSHGNRVKRQNPGGPDHN